MKLQGLSVIFALIVIPMVLVLSYYIQLQVDTITLQTAYDTKLLDATHDAMMAFEINTANEDLSSVADSLRTIIEASNNIFINTLATNMGLSNVSKSYIEPYIPATLYTLYDGYYINSPTKKPEIGVDYKGVALEVDSKNIPTLAGASQEKFSIPGLDCIGTTQDAAGNTYGEYTYTDPHSSNIGNAFDDTKSDTENLNYFSNINTNVQPSDYGQLLYKKVVGGATTYTTNPNDPNIVYNTEYVLKSYMPYAARYIKDNSDNTKDIDITVNYTLDNYLTVVGSIGNVYYTKSGYLIDRNLVTFSTADGAVDLSNYNENDAEQLILNGTKVTIEVDGHQITSQRDTTVSKISDETAAVIYYTKAALFSNWIYDNLGTLQECDIVDIMSEHIMGTTDKGIEEVIYSFDEKTDFIFNENLSPENDGSTFVNHKFQVIRNSIQYNLNLAMSLYNKRNTMSYDFQMPIISASEWETILSNVSIVSFMQGLNCGLKTYNNYAIVSSTNNEITVIPEEIFFVADANNPPAEGAVYHRIDCPLFEYTDPGTQFLRTFKSKEVKYDKVYDRNQDIYKYDHKYLACYTCIVDGNYKKKDLDATEENSTNPADPPNTMVALPTEEIASRNLKEKSYYTALGKERYNIYKMNAIKKSEGYEMIYDTNSTDYTTTIKTSGIISTRGKNEVKRIEVTFGNIVADDSQETVVRFNIQNLHQNIEFVLNTNQAKEQTISININPDSARTDTSKVQLGTVRDNIVILNDPTTVDLAQLKGAIKAVKVIYK